MSNDGIEVGAVIDERWVLDDKLGEGGMGVVFRGHHTITTREVAIKVLAPAAAASADLAERFRREAAATARIKHPGFVDMLDSGVFRNRPYLVMELLEGTTIAGAVSTRGVMAVARACGIVRQVADALAAAHAAGVIHRDIKAENIFLLAGDRVKVLDLGIAKFKADSGAVKGTKTGASFGTPSTMSPEQFRSAGKVAQRSDVYSLGMLTFYMIAGAYPFEIPLAGSTERPELAFAEYAIAHISQDPPRLHQLARHVPPGLGEFLYRCMAKDPVDRPQSMKEVCDLLAEFAGEDPAPRPLSAGPEAATRPPPSPVRPSPAGDLQQVTRTPNWNGEAHPTDPRSSARRALTISTAVVAVLVVGGAAAYFVVARHGAAPPEPTTPTIPAAARPSAPPSTVSKPTKVEPSKIILAIEPPDAELRVDGALRSGQSPFVLEGEPGHKLHVEARRDGYQNVERDLSLGTTDERATLHLEPAKEIAKEPPRDTGGKVGPKGKLDVFVQPWASLSIDGKSFGDAPRRGIALPAGSHKIQLVNQKAGYPESAPWEKRVTIRAGKTETIELDWNGL